MMRGCASRHELLLPLTAVLPEARPDALPAWQSFTNCVRASPVSCLASACLLHTLSEGCLTGVAVGAGGGSAAAGTAPPTMAMAASTVTVFMPSLTSLTWRWGQKLECRAGRGNDRGIKK